jgi:hypothetical protein
MLLGLSVVSVVLVDVFVDVLVEDFSVEVGSSLDEFGGSDVTLSKVDDGGGDLELLDGDDVGVVVRIDVEVGGRDVEVVMRRVLEDVVTTAMQWPDDQVARLAAALASKQVAYGPEMQSKNFE